MNEYQNHVFYEHNHLSIDEKLILMNKACELCYETWVDKLDCKLSIAREKIDMSFDDIIKLFDKNCHFVIIKRRGYDNPYGEIGFSTLGRDVSYYLWINLNINEFNHLLKIYNINEK